MDAERGIVRFARMEWASPAPHVRQKAQELGGQRIRLLELSRGLEHPEWCLAGHVGYVLEGEFALEFDDGTVELKPGDGFILPAGQAGRHRPAPHSGHAARPGVPVSQSPCGLPAQFTA